MMTQRAAISTCPPDHATPTSLQRWHGSVEGRKMRTDPSSTASIYHRDVERRGEQRRRREGYDDGCCKLNYLSLSQSTTRLLIAIGSAGRLRHQDRGLSRHPLVTTSGSLSPVWIKASLGEGRGCGAWEIEGRGSTAKEHIAGDGLMEGVGMPTK